MRRVRDPGGWFDKPTYRCWRWEKDIEPAPSFGSTTKTCANSEARRVWDGSVRYLILTSQNWISRNDFSFTANFVMPTCVVHHQLEVLENQHSVHHPAALLTVLTSSNRSWACSENFWPSFTHSSTCKNDHASSSKGFFFHELIQLTLDLHQTCYMCNFGITLYWT